MRKTKKRLETMEHEVEWLVSELKAVRLKVANLEHVARSGSYLPLSQVDASSATRREEDA